MTSASPGRGVGPFPTRCPPEGILDVARQLLAAEATAKRCRAHLVEQMAALGVHRLEVVGLGFITYIAGGTTTPIDARGCATKLGVLGAQLRALGANDVDDAIPMGVSERRAAVRVNLREAA